jgi:hypothetical protein
MIGDWQSPIYSGSLTVNRRMASQPLCQWANKSPITNRESTTNHRSQITDQKSKMFFMDWAGRCFGPPESGYRFWFRLPPWL